MIITIEQIQAWRDANELEHLEFKEAKNKFDRDELASYCVAIANEGGGQLVLGMTDKPPRQVVGSQALLDLNEVKNQLLQKIHLRVDASEVLHPDGRVVVFQIPARPIGRPVDLAGRYLMRSGQSLVAMTPEQLQSIFTEDTTDFSAEVCPKATIADLDAKLIQFFRAKWRERSKRVDLDKLSGPQLLEDAELLVGGKVTYASLILFGTAKSVTQLLPPAETIFEYRSSTASIPPQQRLEFRKGFLGYLDDIWRLINQRNEVQQLRHGLFTRDIPMFNEFVVREVLMNALCHRDYRNGSSVWVRQYPRQLEVVSPGGFPPGITIENIMFRQNPRNRRIAETLQKCGLVERSNQGAKRMFQESILEGKGFPDFAGTDAYQVSVALRGEVGDARFLAYLNRLGDERRQAFELTDLLVLELVHKEAIVPDVLRQSLQRLRDAGAIETTGRGRGTRYILTRGVYNAIGEPGTYTRKRGLDEGEKKALLLKHIKSCGGAGCAISDLERAVTSVPRTTLKRMLNDLKREGAIELTGERRASRWRDRGAKTEKS
ncbi:hypothetical protein PLCT2_00551 [Planctomycetaceae bacterium]|nr:hypothetical protein PLCT2_00551 [Planctomycetaceae bacterium]